MKPGYTWHRHVPLTDGRARNAQVYPEGLVRAIVQGLLRHLRSKKAWVCGISVGPVNQENDIDFSLFNNSNDDDWRTFVDEVSGKTTEHRHGLRRHVKKNSILQSVTMFGLWCLHKNAGTIQVLDRLDQDGSISTRVTTRIHHTDPGLVIQEVRHSGIEAIFAATPPLESIRFFAFPCNVRQKRS